MFTPRFPPCPTSQLLAISARATSIRRSPASELSTHLATKESRQSVVHQKLPKQLMVGVYVVGRWQLTKYPITSLSPSSGTPHNGRSTQFRLLNNVNIGPACRVICKSIVIN